MRNILDCVNAFIPLLNTEYEIILGRKGVSITIRIVFDKKDCYHLMGLQYLLDRPKLNKDRGRVFDEIKKGIITIEQVESSDFYSKIQNRVDLLPLLEMLLDNNDTIFKYNKKANVCSMIDAEYLMKNNMENRNIFIFLSYNARDNVYFCKSFFPEDKIDYTRNQASWTLLYKKKIDISTGKEEILYDKLNRNNQIIVS